MGQESLGLLHRFRDQMLATARRYSTNPHDADDAYQRAAEIVLNRSPAGSDDELGRWLRTTVKHEALAIRRQRDRVRPAGPPERVPEPRIAPPDTHEQAERSERLRLGAQALGALKPQEVRCLLLKAEGYSYHEICDATGFSYTKVNRCLSEGRRAFLAHVAGIESGAECRRVASHLSALADGEADRTDLAAVRPHLRGCLACRALLREYRAVPARVAALAPPAALAAGSSDVGPMRSFLESLLGAVQHKVGAVGERAHQAVELAGGQKAAAVAASAAALAGGGALGAERIASRPDGRDQPAAEVRRSSAETPAATQAPVADAPAPPAPAPATPTPTEGPTPAPAAPPPPAAASPPPQPADEFTPAPSGAQAAATAPPASPAPPAAPAPVVRSGGGGGGGGAGGGGGGEFGP